MKTFFDLIQEIQKPGLCHRCGGCVTFCTAVNYGALELDEDGKPRFGDIEKCIECGLCHAICPEIDELEAETKIKTAWSEPMGRVLDTTVACAQDPEVREHGTDGGVVTALLLHLFERGRIDGAIVTKPVGKFQRQPFLATSREEILTSAGFFFDTSHGMKEFSDQYMTYSSIEEFDPLVKKGLNRVALVGTPCQVKSVRRMQVLGLIPSESIRFCLGLFCSGNFLFDEQGRRKLADLGAFQWEEVRKVNVKEHFLVHLKNASVKHIDLEAMGDLQRFACRFCPDYSAEYADIAFGGIGAEEGWTTVITRSPLGRAALADAVGAGALSHFSGRDKPQTSREAFQKVQKWSERKKARAQSFRSQLGSKTVIIKD